MRFRTGLHGFNCLQYLLILEFHHPFLRRAKQPGSFRLAHVDFWKDIPVALSTCITMGELQGVVAPSSAARHSAARIIFEFVGSATAYISAWVLLRDVLVCHWEFHSIGAPL